MAPRARFFPFLVPAMRLTRRYLTFSPRTLFVLTTALAVWLGVVVNRVREQREAVKAIEALGGEVRYDWQLRYLPGTTNLRVEPEPPGPACLRRILGDDFFQDVHAVDFADVGLHPFPLLKEPTEPNIIRAIPYLQRLRTFKGVVISKSLHNNAESKLKAALPDCQVILYTIDR